MVLMTSIGQVEDIGDFLEDVGQEIKGCRFIIVHSLVFFAHSAFFIPHIVVLATKAVVFIIIDLM